MTGHRHKTPNSTAIENGTTPLHISLNRLRLFADGRAGTSVDAKRIARQQAALLLSGYPDTSAAIPIEIITNRRDIGVEYVSDQRRPSAGFWDTTTKQWVIQVATTINLKQQRLAIAREFKHILDYRSSDAHPASNCPWATVAADEFAAHLLVPELRLRDALQGGITTIDELSDNFAVPQLLIRQRLTDTGLTIYTEMASHQRIPAGRRV